MLGKAEVRHLKITLNKSALSEGDVDRTGAWRKESVGDLLQSHIQMSKERLGSVLQRTSPEAALGVRDFSCPYRHRMEPAQGTGHVFK